MHKHHDMIVAWAKGATIQFRDPKITTEWCTLSKHLVINWHDNCEYRIKPGSKPDRSNEYHVQWPLESPAPEWHQKALCNLLLTFDGETGVLKEAEVINEK